MTDTDPKPLSEFTVSTGTFFVTARELKISRRWSRSVLDSEGDTEFSVLVRGVAIGNQEDVCVIGTNHRSSEFEITIGSDRNTQQSWEQLKRLSLLAYGDKFANSPEGRIRDLQYDLLGKSPPTAILSGINDDWEGNWSLECKIAETLLEQLVADIAARRVDSITIGIEWAVGHADAHDTWGLVKLPEAQSPEPLRGHVLIFEWLLGTVGATAQGPWSDKLAEASVEWTESFTETRKEKGEPWMDRSARVIFAMADRVEEWHREHNESPDDLRRTLDRVQDFMDRLDSALHTRLGPFADEKESLWEHRLPDDIYRKTVPYHREHFIEMFELGNLVTEYLATPQLHHPYLDWIMLDAITSGSIIAALERYMNERHGIAYVRSGGVRWKMYLWKLVLWSLTFLLGWGLPAVVCYFIADWSVAIAIGLGVIWYGSNLFGMAVRLWLKISHLFSGKPTQRQLINEAGKVYALLAGPVMHIRTVRTAFERAAERGVIWDQQVFYILDQLAKENPRVWDNRTSALFPLRDGSYRP